MYGAWYVDIFMQLGALVFVALAILLTISHVRRISSIKNKDYDVLIGDSGSSIS